MALLRRIELLLGVLSGIFGVLALAYDLFYPTDCPANAATRADCQSLVQHQGAGLVGLLLVIGGLPVAGAVIAAVYHSRQGSSAGALVLLWVFALLLVLVTRIGTVATFYFIPAALLAMADAVLGTLSALLSRWRPGEPAQCQ